jgi:catechol 2,3-dioxygenase-like lactoylglutathione lyase family enzyme
MSKRFHVHMHVDDLDANIGFYSKLFGTTPTRTERDYAKWMLDDPPVNFAISTWGAKAGIDHLGIQTDDDAELAAMRERATSADLTVAVEEQVSCCYAKSDKHWITDPQGMPWEHFRTLADVPTFSARAESATSACCTPARGKAVGIPVKAAGAASCC